MIKIYNILLILLFFSVNIIVCFSQGDNVRARNIFIKCIDQYKSIPFSKCKVVYSYLINGKLSEQEEGYLISQNGEQFYEFKNLLVAITKSCYAVVDHEEKTIAIADNSDLQMHFTRTLDELDKMVNNNEYEFDCNTAGEIKIRRKNDKSDWIDISYSGEYLITKIKYYTAPMPDIYDLPQTEPQTMIMSIHDFHTLSKGDYYCLSDFVIQQENRGEISYQPAKKYANYIIVK
jgi:hypothetical protein